MPDGVLDQNDQRKEGVRHVTVDVERRHLLGKHEHVFLFGFLQVGLHPLRKRRRGCILCVDQGKDRVRHGQNEMRVFDLCFTRGEMVDGLRPKAYNAAYTKDVPQSQNRSALEGMATGSCPT